MDDFLIFDAIGYALAAHKGQKRKYTGEDYFVHCAHVAHLVEQAGGTREMIAAAYLHDTLEDTRASYDDLVRAFGRQVADLVDELTDKFTPEAYPHLNRKARKALECKRLASISPEAKAIKRADIADNSASIEEHDPNFAKVWLAEKAEMLKVL